MTSTGIVTTLRGALVACPLLLAAPAAALAGQAAPAWAAQAAQVQAGHGQAGFGQPEYGQSGQTPAAPPVVSTGADAALPLSLSEAIDRGLKANLGVLLGQAGVRTAEGERWEALSDLLPNVDGHISETRQRANLESFGFTADLLPGVPKIVGPFNVFDARITASQAVVDLSAVDRLRARARSLSAARYSAQDARDVVVLGITNLYLQAVAATSRIEAKQAELATSKALYDLAADMKQAGTVAGIDVLRAQVQWQADQQQLIVLRNDFAKQKLVLARAVGLDPTKPIELTDRISYQATPPMTADAALSRALEQRADLKAASAHLAAAQLEKRASFEERLPTFGLTGNYGVIGLKASDSLMTFAIGAGVTVPIFEGGRINGKIAKADATLRERQAELDDLTRQVKYEVQAALLDLGAAAERVQVAQSSVTLAGQQETQAQDRFKAGVANSLELVQAQAAVAAANESYIAAIYEHNLAKASLARSLGIADASIKQFVSGAIQ